MRADRANGVASCEGKFHVLRETKIPMDIPLHPRLRAAADVTEALIDVSQRLAKAAARRATPAGSKRNSTLRPGPGTPMWNALVLAVRPHLQRYGAKINLGRELGVPPQRIHEYFVARTATPDAERTLLVMHWLAVQPAMPGPGKMAKAAGRAGRRAP